ncbi:CehA/McbA family metallohydrolase [Aestuariibacter salexigens]|uniref:CehA/McbA family metallohydrolase n=1 Tax=Aestuariibacter salexigens TaxID=226010 RepID=UPI00041BA721|nr:CehA/McbA family metallohydrolase [Aestuariibacter salexigens]
MRYFSAFTANGLSVIALLFTCSALAQWVNHYPKLDDFGHHVYLEQHELPILAHGITDPAPSPDGKHIAIASKGWIWLLDVSSGVATRLTSSRGVDSRPRWSPDGRYLAFVRDFGHDTSVVIKALESGEEQLINSPAIDIDPEFSHNGQHLFYSSGETGSLDLFQWHLGSGQKQQVTELRQVERNVRQLHDRSAFIYLHGSGAHRTLRLRDMLAGQDDIIHAQTLTYHLTSDVHPSRDLLVFSAPIDNDYHLWTMDINDPRVKNRLTNGHAFALTPAFSADGDSIYYVILTEGRQFQLMRIATYGGTAEAINVDKWDYGSSTGTLKVRVESSDKNTGAARVSIADEQGHPVANPVGATFVDPQTGRTYFYVDGEATLTLPVGQYFIEAVQGPFTPVMSRQVTVKESQSSSLSLTFTPIWDAKTAGYMSADFHVHLNGDGHHRATHQDALLQMRGEDLNLLAPQSWNRWERRIDEKLIGQHTSENEFTVMQGQEVRSHFHGHVGLINVNTPFTPWFFGPTNPVLGDPNLTNARVFDYAKNVGAFATYVHPVAGDGDPFAQSPVSGIPLELVSDGVLEERMGIELVCAWTSPLGTAEVWYRLLNIGQPVVAMSGTDTWIDFHRTPAVGTGRTYVRVPAEQRTDEALVSAALAGRSVLTTGPMLELSVADNVTPGGVIESGTHDYAITLSSTAALEYVELIVNGKVVQRLDGIQAATTKHYAGTISLPPGGWIAARAYAAEQRADSWPSMHARPFVHTSPIWIENIGSTEPSSRKAAAKDLLMAIDAAEQRAKSAYGDRDMPALYGRFAEARERLKFM